MKKITTVITILYSLWSAAQTAYSTDDITFSLPNGAVKIAPSSLDPTIKKNEKLLLSDHIYKINDLYLRFSNSTKGQWPPNDFENLKKAMDYDMKRMERDDPNLYKSSVQTINNNKVIIMYDFYEGDNIGDYLVLVKNKDKTEVFSGGVYFEGRSKYDEATTLLNNFLASVTFKSD